MLYTNNTKADYSLCIFYRWDVILMKIEKISDSQIRCTLNRSDLQSRELKLSELAYGTEKAKNLFHDMIEQAAHQFGFKADDIPLMIEAIPVSADCIILNITKVEDPEELDTKFSRFTPSDDMDMDDDMDDDYDDLLPDNINLPESPDMNLFHNILKEADNFLSMKDTLKNISDESVPDIEDDTTEAEAPGDAEEDNLIYKLFSFRSLGEADNAAKHVNASYEGESILYKDNIKCLYFLLLSCSQKHSNDLLKVCNEITEYGHKESIVFGTSAYLNEHCDIIIKHDALSVLSNL